MPVRLTEAPDGTPNNQLTGTDLAVRRLDDFVKEIQDQKLCDTSKVIDFVLDLRNDLTIRA